MFELFFGFALLASAITTNKIILSYAIQPTFFVALRMLAASLCLLSYSYLRSTAFRFATIKNDLFTIARIAFLTTALPSMLKAYALQNLTSSKAAFLGSLDPFVTALLASFLLNEKITLNKAIGICIGFTGTAYLLLGHTPAEGTLIGYGIFSWPEIAALVAVGILRYGWIQAQLILKAGKYTAMELNGLMMLLGGFMALVPSLFTNPCAFTTIPCTQNFFWLFAYTVIIGNLIAYTFYANFLKKYSTTLVSLVGLSVPLFVQLYGWFILHEELSSRFAIAFIITIVGMYIFYKDELKWSDLKK